jgi:hypothetical protein
LYPAYVSPLPLWPTVVRPGPSPDTESAFPPPLPSMAVALRPSLRTVVRRDRSIGARDRAGAAAQRLLA